jgi:hypothetical protein
VIAIARQTVDSRWGDQVNGRAECWYVVLVSMGLEQMHPVTSLYVVRCSMVARDPRGLVLGTNMNKWHPTVLQRSVERDCCVVRA